MSRFVLTSRFSPRVAANRELRKLAETLANREPTKPDYSHRLACALGVLSLALVIAAFV